MNLRPAPHPPLVEAMKRMRLFVFQGACCRHRHRKADKPPVTPSLPSSPRLTVLGASPSGGLRSGSERGQSPERSEGEEFLPQ
jgi:hypothetical protein